MSNNRTLEQMRADHALRSVKALVDDSNRADYLRISRGLAATVVNNGLGQTCAMLLSKAEGRRDAHRRMYDHLSEWLGSDEFAAPYQGQDDLIGAITTKEQDAYVHAQSEALAWLEWTKKFSSAFLSD